MKFESVATTYTFIDCVQIWRNVFIYYTVTCTFDTHDLEQKAKKWILKKEKKLHFPPKTFSTVYILTSELQGLTVYVLTVGNGPN